MTTAQNYSRPLDKTYSLSRSQKLQRLALKACCNASPALGVKIALHYFMHARKYRPYAVNELPAKLQTANLAYHKGYIVTHTWGSGDKIIYLVHGWESNSKWMKGFIAPLIKDGYKVIAFDMPAHGRSSKQPTHLGDFAATLEFVISVYGKPFGIVAHSFGGTATVLLLSKKPHLSPKKLCLISPMKSLDSHFQVFNTVIGLSESIMDKLFLTLKKHYALEAQKTDITQLIKNIKIPGLLIHDENDRLIPVADGDHLAATWSGARYLKTSELGHRKILQDSQVIREATDYILGRH
jgi:pimeloyl-ACP methyl ester carboxylesterase